MTAFSGALGVIAIDVRELSLHGPHLAALPFFAPLLVDVPTGLTPGDARFVASLRATPALQQQRRHLLEAYLREQFAAVTRLLPSKMDRNSPVSSFGIDSILALELRNRLERSLDIRLSATLVWAHPTICDLATHLAGRLGIELDEPPAAGAPTVSPVASIAVNAIVEQVETMSEAEALQVLTGDSEQ